MALHLNKQNRETKTSIKDIIGMNYQKAAFLFNDKSKVENLINELEENILQYTTIIDDFSDIKKYIRIIKDANSDGAAVVSPECIVTIIAAFMYINSSISGEVEGSIPNRKALISYIEKRHKRDIVGYLEWEKWTKPGIYPIVPTGILDSQETESIALLTRKYEKLIAPTITGKSVKKIKSLVPDVVKNQIEQVTDAITAQEFYSKLMQVVANGFDILIKNASKVSLSEKYIVNQVNKTLGEENHIFKLEEVCCARSYDISKLVNRFKTKNVFVALGEGGITGFAGIAGIPINIASSLFIYYRAIQSVAMYYGYDVKNNAQELQIASDVFMQALSPTTGSASESGDMIVKFMTMSEALVVKDVINGGWKAMADRGGICLVITQIRALAHKSAQKALEAAGQKGIEETMFTGLLKQLGKQMTQDSVKKAVSPIAAIITALADMSTMNKVVEYADIFYNKRFIAEKQIRIESLNNPDIIKDVDFDVID